MKDPLKSLIWLYFALLVGEGVLRKWILPGYAEPLLIIRDPIVILIFVIAFAKGIFPLRLAVLALLAMALVSVAFAMIAGGSVFVTLFGLRTNYLHPILIFVMPSVLSRQDVIKFGKAVLWLSVPIAWLMLLQYNGGKTGMLNVGAGGSIGGQLDGALDKLRPSGPFSFVTGPVAWFALATGYIFYGWTNPGYFSRVVLVAASLATLLAIPISISRSLLMSVVVVLLFGMVSLARDIRKSWRIVLPVLVLAGFFSLIEERGLTDAFDSRWQDSTVKHGGIQISIVQRFLHDYTTAWGEISNARMFGEGIGLGSNVGARLATGEVRFLLAESEWPKIILELGPLLGVAFILFRCWLASHVMLQALGCLFRRSDSLAWLLGGAGFLSLLSGQWGQPTLLGFAVFIGGLALSATNEDEDEDEIQDDDEDEALLVGTEEIESGRSSP
jgi:hypothetical protein